MTTYEQDPDVVRWGLNLLDGCLPSNSANSVTTFHDDANFHNVQNVRSHYGMEGSSSIENEELPEHAFREELSQPAVVEASGSSKAEEEHLQASILAQDWFSRSVRNYCPGFGHDCGPGADHMGTTSSCSSLHKKSYTGEELPISLEITDESFLDGEVGKRLNQMVPIPHVPRINGEIPSVDEATSDHQRLLDRLQLYDLAERKVQGDGNCQFCALSDQFYRTSEHHKFVRQQIVNQLKSHPEIYEGYVPMAYGEYLKRISKVGEWGDHVTLQAAADSYGVKIFVITSFKDTCYIEILPNIQKSKRVIFLSFWAEVHYNSIYPEGDFPEYETKKKRRWCIFRNNH